MAHAAMRVREKLLNTPHLITQKSFDSILSYLDSRDDAVDVKEIPQLNSDGGDRINYNNDTGVGFINIDGALTYRPTGMEMLCGGTSYTSVLEQMQELVNMGASVVVLSVDSGGGEAYGMMETARMLRRIADENSVKLLTYVDGVSASAAYGLSVAAHEVIVNPDAEVGSVGVVVRLMNDSKALEKEGIERTFIYAGENKIPFAADGSFRSEFLKDIQDKVDMLYSKFTNFVSEMRNIPLEDVVGTQAAVVSAEESLSIGFADKIMTREEFFTYLADTVEKKTKGGLMLSRFYKTNTQKVSAEMTKEVELQAQLSEVQERLAASDVMVAELEAKVAELSAGFETERVALVAKYEEQIAAKQAELDALLKAQVEAVTQERKAKLEAVVGTAKAGEIFEVVKDMSQEQFDVIVGSLKTSVEVESRNEMFSEVGKSGEKEEATPTHFSTYLKKAKK